MRIATFESTSDMTELQNLVSSAFATTGDAKIDEWFSFPYMQKMIDENRGLCLVAISDENKIIGMVYAQQENPINGKEGEEKWVIIVMAVLPGQAGLGVGSKLLSDLEGIVRQKGVLKLFSFTNSTDKRVIHFYEKNGYVEAGTIKDYQYGNNNSAVFLLKHLD